MNDLVDVHETPELSAPVMLIALEGWIDAGGAASNAMATMLATTDPQPVASFDADRIIDHRARRPIMQLVNGLITGLTWPSTELMSGSDAEGNDLLLLSGAEPDFEWTAFTESVLEIAEDFECRMMVYFGAYPAPVPHSRPINLAVTTSSVTLSDQLRGYVRGSLDVPAGIQASLDIELNRIGIPTLGLWAQVPHYVSSMAYPGASLALLEGLRDVAGLSLDTGQLAIDAAATRDRLDALVAENPEHQAMVHQLEQVVDSGLGGPDEDAPLLGLGDLPSGDELAAELQEFLNQRPEDD
jgi:hypothetical protein